MFSIIVTINFQTFELYKDAQDPNNSSSSGLPESDEDHEDHEYDEDSEENTALDCSASSWSGYAPHLSCDLVVDCQTGEDEAGCLHACGEGGFAEGTSCYYVKLKKLGVHGGLQAQMDCRSDGGRLVSFNTGEEWDRVTWKLQRSPVVGFYYGLRNPASSWPL